jgi:hypothetical protein
VGNRVDGAGRTNWSVGQSRCSVCVKKNRIPHNAIVAVVRATCFSVARRRKYCRRSSSVIWSGLR